MKWVKWCVASEDSLVVYFLEGDLASRNDRVNQVNHHLLNLHSNWLTDTVPAYDSLFIQFDPFVTDHMAVKFKINQIITFTCSINNGHSAQTGAFTKKSSNDKIIKVPVWYDAPKDNDLSRIAKHHHISVEQVIKKHTSRVYHVYCCGFSPGFAYMGEVDPAIAMPRLNTPRKKVPKGAVGIADSQTAIYPNASPGGWNILGLCPLEQFDRNLTPPNRLSVGDKVQFEQIDQQQYQALLEETA